MVDWTRFEGIAKPEEVQEAQDSFKPIDAGEYVMKLESIEPSETKDGLPMLKGKLRMLDNNRLVFYNQTLQNITRPDMTKFNIAEAVEFVSGLVGEKIQFKSIPALAEVITGITVGGLYKVKVSYGTKDLEMKFPKLKITEKIDGEVPFEE